MIASDHLTLTVTLNISHANFITLKVLLVHGIIYHYFVSAHMLSCLKADVIAKITSISIQYIIYNFQALIQTIISLCKVTVNTC